MLVLKSIPEQSQDGAQVYVEFRNATGNYVAASEGIPGNPGGFGSPNPERNTLAILILAKHRLTTGDVDAEISAYNPLNVQSFTIAMTRAKNGILKYDIFALPIFNVLTDYDDGDVVWDNTNPVVPIIKKQVDDEWEELELEDLLSESIVVQLNSHTLVIPDAGKFKNELLAILVTASQAYRKNLCKKEDYDTAAFNFNTANSALESATNAFCVQAYNEAQEDVEFVLTIETEMQE